MPCACWIATATPLPSFNDDIQGTAAVGARRDHGRGARPTGTRCASSGSCMPGRRRGRHRHRPAVAGRAGRGGAARREADAGAIARRLRGLVVAGREDPKAQGGSALAGRRGGHVRFRRRSGHGPAGGGRARVRPTVLIGTTGEPGAFTEPVIRAVASRERRVRSCCRSPTPPPPRGDRRPTSSRWTGGRGRGRHRQPLRAGDARRPRHAIGQGNNVFIFPGLGLGRSSPRRGG